MTKETGESEFARNGHIENYEGIEVVVGRVYMFKHINSFMREPQFCQVIYASQERIKTTAFSDMGTFTTICRGSIRGLVGNLDAVPQREIVNYVTDCQRKLNQLLVAAGNNK